MNAQPLIYFAFRVLIAVFLIPITMLSFVFSRFFGRALRIAIEKKGLNEAQRTLNFKGIAGIFGLARGAVR